MLKLITHAMEIQIFTGELVQIYHEPSQLIEKEKQKIYQIIELFMIEENE